MVLRRICLFSSFLLAVAFGALQMCVPRASAETLTVDFTSTAQLNATETTAFWNLADGRIEAPRAVGGVAGSELDFGDGSLGDFSDGPQQTRISVAGNTITLDTSTSGEFQFRSFSLSAGKTLQVTGTNPLVIRVLGATSILGTVDLNGTAGTDNGAAGAGNHTAGVIPGPAGRAGAGGGGNGASYSPAQDGAAGTPASGTQARGGGAGTNVASSTAARGGGGGCLGKDTDGFDAGDGDSNVGSAGVCSVTRASVASGLESVFVGGGGGGGGGACVGGTCNADVGGGSGGAGGGALRIVSGGPVTVGAGGIVQARGGNGGNNPADNGSFVDCGAAGGGGAGGAVWIQTPGGLSGSGTVDVRRGDRGESATCAGYSFGGHGSRGILRVDTASGSFTLGAIQPTGSADHTGTLSVAAAQTYSAISNAIDFGTSEIVYDSVSETKGCTTPTALSVRYSGSSDGVNFGSWVSRSELGLLTGLRYLRFQVEISTAGGAAPCLTGLSFTYRTGSAANLREFQIQGGLFCATLEGTRRTSTSAGGLIQLGLIFLVAWGARRFSVRSPNSARS